MRRAMLIEDSPLVNLFCNLLCCFSKVRAQMHISSSLQAKDNNETLIFIALDAEKALDVVDHIHPFWKIYHKDITASTWLLIKESYQRTDDTMTKRKRQT
jgi:hypothetical protein